MLSIYQVSLSHLFPFSNAQFILTFLKKIKKIVFTFILFTSVKQSGRWAAMRDERAAIKAVIEQSFGSHVDQFTSDFQNIVQNFVIILFDLD